MKTKQQPKILLKAPRKCKMKPSSRWPALMMMLEETSILQDPGHQVTHMNGKMPVQVLVC
jgi:hypothetical protein